MQNANIAMKNRIEEWLPRADERLKELEMKSENAANDRARVVLQHQADELRTQIRALEHELEEPLTSPAEMFRGNDMRAHK